MLNGCNLNGPKTCFIFLLMQNIISFFWFWSEIYCTYSWQVSAPFSQTESTSLHSLATCKTKSATSQLIKRTDWSVIMSLWLLLSVLWCVDSRRSRPVPLPGLLNNIHAVVVAELNSDDVGHVDVEATWERSTNTDEWVTLHYNCLFCRWAIINKEHYSWCLHTWCLLKEFYYHALCIIYAIYLLKIRVHLSFKICNWSNDMTSWLFIYMEKFLNDTDMLLQIFLHVQWWWKWRLDHLCSLFYFLFFFCRQINASFR